jgi:Domain of unknown function (DUF4160)
MPEVSRFYGIVIRIFYDDHNPPHFHAEYGEYEVLVAIQSLAIPRGWPARSCARDGDGMGLLASARALGSMGASEPAPAATQDRAAAVSVWRSSHDIAVRRQP